MNAVAALVLALYLGLVQYSGNRRRLADELAKEGDFLKWLLALWILLALRRSFNLAPIADSVIILGFVALLLNVGGVILPQLQKMLAFTKG